jgi:putative membrane protein
MRKGFVWMTLVSLFAMVCLALPATAAEKSSLARGDKAFVKSVAAGGMLEVQLGELAAKNAAAQEVKDFGQRMVTDHGKANDELKTLAANKNVTLPTELKGKQKEKVDRMSKLTGAEFDKKYMQAMVKDHVKDVKKFQKGAKDVKDPELKDWVTKTLPTLEQHLEQAKEVAKKVGAEMK